MGKIAKPIVKKKPSFEKKSPKHGVRKSQKQHDGKTNAFSKSFSESLLESLNVKDDNTHHDNTQHPGVAKKSNKANKSRVVKKIKKKDKLNIKKKLLLKKIDIVKQMKKELKLRNKRKNTALIGDTNPLHDALPSLEPLLKMKHGAAIEPKENKKKKGVEKAAKRKKQTIKDVEIFKKALRNESFKANPFETISNHIQSVVQYERNKIK